MEIKEQIEKLINEKNDIEKKIKDLQDSCPHKNVINVNYMWRVGSLIPATCCNDCNKILSTAFDDMNPPADIQ